MQVGTGEELDDAHAVIVADVTGDELPQKELKGAVFVKLGHNRLVCTHKGGEHVQQSGGRGEGRRGEGGRGEERRLCEWQGMRGSIHAAARLILRSQAESEGHRRVTSGRVATWPSAAVG